MLLENGEDVLEEIELFVAGGGPEIVAIDDERFLGRLACLVDDGHAAFLAERRIGQDDFVFAVFPGQRVLGDDRQLGVRAPTYTMKEQIHGTQARDAVHQFNTENVSLLSFFFCARSR